LTQSKHLEIDGENANEKNLLAVTIEIGIDTGMGTATGTEIPGIGGVIDTTTPVIEIGIDGMIHLTEIERGEVIDATTHAAVQGGMIQGIGGPMRGTDDLMRGIDEEMTRLENCFLLVLRGMDDLDLQIHLFQFHRLNRLVRRLLHPRRLRREPRRQRRVQAMLQGMLDQTM
jgi:hypothetical protein